MPDVSTIRVIFPTPLMTFIQVVIPEPVITSIRVLGLNASGANILSIGPYARLRAIIGGPPNGVALDVFDVGTNTWIEQWEYTQ